VFCDGLAWNVIYLKTATHFFVRVAVNVGKLEKGSLWFGGGLTFCSGPDIQLAAHHHQWHLAH
jgi:hypothetical protein